MTYHIIQNPSESEDKKIFTADNSNGYIKNGELHLVTPIIYYLYKFANNRWYIRNDIAGTDHYLGTGASPTITVNNLTIIDKDYWDKINIVEEE
jgi:hypothetical protein